MSKGINWPGRNTDEGGTCCVMAKWGEHLYGCPNERDMTEAEELLFEARKQAERDAESAYDAVMHEAGF